MKGEKCCFVQVMILELGRGAHRSCGSDVWVRRNEERACGAGEKKWDAGFQVVDRQCCNKMSGQGKPGEGRPAGSMLSSPPPLAEGKGLTGSVAPVCLCVLSSST